MFAIADYHNTVYIVEKDGTRLTSMEVCNVYIVCLWKYIKKFSRMFFVSFRLCADDISAK